LRVKRNQKLTEWLSPAFHARFTFHLFAKLVAEAYCKDRVSGRIRRSSQAHFEWIF
jgi:hypothetical protein